MAFTVLLALAHLHGAVAVDPASVLKRLADAYRELEALEAKLVQTSSYPQLGLTDPPETGRLQIEKTRDGMNVRLEFTEPVQRLLVIEDGEYVFFQPRIHQAIVGRASEHQNSRTGGFLKYLLGDLSGAEEDFEVEVLGKDDVSGRTTTRLRLVPRDRSESYYQSIELWVDEGLSLPIQEKLVEPNGDQILIRLSDITINPPTDDFRFEIDLPPDVERLQG